MPRMSFAVASVVFDGLAYMVKLGDSKGAADWLSNATREDIEEILVAALIDKAHSL